MDWISTRGHGPVDWATALREGPAPDGGLYLPERTEPRLGGPPGAELHHTATWLLGPWLEGAAPEAEVARVAREAFAAPVPLVRLDDDTWVLELSHGPTGAFKDFGARFLARALACWAPPERAGRTILVATSGDTGGAVAHAFHRLPRARVVVLFPADGVSELQRRQFTTLGHNVTAAALDGSFDDCQRLVLAALADPELRDRHQLTSANSLNVGRLLPQAAYYFHAALSDAWRGGAAPTFVVPSGNLGNLTAGLLAARAGARTAGFVAALNANDGFARWLGGEGPGTDGVARTTLSNAMDVARPSNLERLAALVADDRARLAREVTAVSVGDRETLEAMRELEGRFGYVADPHTAVGFAALTRLRTEGLATRPAVLLATAHPGKFPDTVHTAIGRPPPSHPGLADPSTPERVVDLGASPADLESLLGTEVPR